MKAATFILRLMLAKLFRLRLKLNVVRTMIVNGKIGNNPELKEDAILILYPL